MKFGKLTLLANLAVSFVCAAGWARPATDSQSASKSATKNASNSPKEKHWTGTLVDVSCMNKTLGAGSIGSPAGLVFGTPHLLGWGAAIPQKTLDHAPMGNTLPATQDNFMPAGQQQPGQPGQQGNMPSTGPGTRSPEPMPGTMEQLPDPNAAAEARATKVNAAARACAASRSTQTVGLATGEGQVWQFDEGGNAKAREALKNADVPPGKRIKAKVTGTLRDESTLKVASIELKGTAKQAWRMTNNADV